ncbi:MAG: hypothetical protein JNL57_05985 [Bacteroidetes bacterium]|nr:hypothetical protein [Bacteroidota bacterium]
MAKGLKYKLGLRALKKLSVARPRNRSFMPFGEVKDVLLAWDESQHEQDIHSIQKFIQFLEKHGKQVQTVVYHHTRKESKITIPEGDTSIHLSRRDFNAFGMPRSLQIKKLLSTQFDYFINMNLDGRLTLKSIAGFTNAACRIGFQRDKAISFYDLLIGSQNEPDMQQYVKDLQHYLQKIG